MRAAGAAATRRAREVGSPHAEAAPIRRTVIALRWLAEEGDSVLDVMALEHAAPARRIVEATRAANWTSVDQHEIQALIDEIDEKSRDHTMKEFKHFSKQYKDRGAHHVVESAGLTDYPPRGLHCPSLHNNLAPAHASCSRPWAIQQTHWWSPALRSPETGAPKHVHAL
jgi:hypothetical protein